MQDVWGDSGLVRLWAYGGGTEGGAARWRGDHDLWDVPILIDTDSSIQRAYFMASGSEDAFAQNPRHIVIDRDGNLRWAGSNLAPEEEDAALAAALGESE